MSFQSADPPLDRLDMQAGLRRNRFLYAVLASGTSKLLALIVQLVALPLALRTLGEDRYAGFLTLQSFVGWTGIFGLGLVPALPKFIAAARARHDEGAERNLIVTAIVAMTIVSVLVFAGLAILGLIVSPANLISAHHIDSGELFSAYFVAVAASSLSLLTSIDPAIRAGSQELHRASICVVIANIIVLVGLYLFSQTRGSLWLFFIVLNIPISVLLILDLVLLFGQRPYLAQRNVQFLETARGISSHSNNALVIQASFAMLIYLPTLVVAHFSDAHQTAIFGSISLELFFALASMNLIFQPLIAAMADAHSHNDVRWVIRNYWRSMALVSAIGIFAIVVGGAVGPWLISKWLGGGLEISRAMGITFGAFFLGLILAQLHFYVLSAIGGLPSVGKLYLFQGVAGLSLGAVLCLWYGAEGMALGLLLAMAAVGWAFCRAVQRQLKIMTLPLLQAD